MDFPYPVETALLVLAVFVVGCCIGADLRRLFPRRAAAASEPSPEPASQPVETPAPTAPLALSPQEHTESGSDSPETEAPPAAKPSAAPRPPGLAAPRKGVKDDLRRIRGIGPRLESALNDLGIFHFSQIARWTKKNVVWLDEHLTLRGRIAREKWIEQARELSRR